jgi:hypothetical protein
VVVSYFAKHPREMTDAELNAEIEHVREYRDEFTKLLDGRLTALREERNWRALAKLAGID